MCGIAGFCDIRERKSLSDLKKMTDAIAYRGPDGDGHWSNDVNTVFLGHRRLSIIDLSACGAQPMHYLNRYTIIYNGEIYNYIELKENLVKNGFQFKSHSDTEVILAMYHKLKEDCLQYFDGMFSIVIYDAVENTLFCARDRFGEKPFFYYYNEGEKFYFGSEMKVLWSVGIDKTINNKMLFNYLDNGMIQNPCRAEETFFDNIYRLKPAHYIKLSVSSCKIIDHKKYWSIDDKTIEERSEKAAIEKFRELFSNSVKRRLRSDVPVGSSLSGGLDSSLVVLMIDGIKGKEQVQKTFSARFPGFSRDEGFYMQKVIDQCNIEPHFVYPSDKDFVEHVEKIFYHQEEPFGSSSIYAQYEVMRAARKNNIIVMLDGQGADEILAGYHVYFSSFFRELKKNKKLFKQEYNAYKALHSDNTINPVNKGGIREMIRESSYYHLAKKLRNNLNQQVNPIFNKDFYHHHNSKNFHESLHFNNLNQHLKRSATGSSLEQLLRYADRNSMAHSLEVRLPFLSHELVEYIFSLPSTYKIHDGWTKWIMRVSYQDLLPKQIAWRKDKIGYEPPQNDWFNKKEIKDLINDKKRVLVENGILHKNVLKDHTTSENNNQQSWNYWMAASLLKNA
jgi:asparagine synthase (glutamine-hydrolysing)